jgi:murein DD-endopeptidase MepM/ murein hydrolase activator NlpD
MKWKKYFSILIIPHNKGRILEKKISALFIYLLSFSFFLLILVNLLFSLGILGKALNQAKLSQLEKENKYLESRLVDLNSVILNLKAEMASLIKKEGTVRMVFGLPEVDAQLREVGVGGPMPNQFFNRSLTMKQAHEAEVELDKLLRQARFERESFDEIYLDLSDKKEILDNTPSICPTLGYLSRGFGTKEDPFTGRAQPHLGIDLAADIGTPVYVTADGKVSSVETDAGLGKTIIISHLSGYTTVYGHLSLAKVVRGQYVKRGEVIGAVGNTGYCTGPHLHYEVHFQGQPKNPLNYILSSPYLLD